jgi:MtrB/PioB family decaheme-associated outer membrane protein
MMKKYLLASLVMIFSVSALSQNLQAEELTTLYNIRLGQHSGFTRLVFDSGGPRPQKIGPATADSVTIVYTQLELERSPSRLFRDLKGAVANVRHQREANQSVITVTFSGSNTAVKSFYMQGKPTEKIGYMLILDFYPAGSALVGPGTLVAVAGATAVAAPSPATAVQIVETQSPVPAATAAAPAVAQVDAAEDEEEEPSDAENYLENFSGEIGFVLRARNDDAKDSLYTQYRDPQAVSGEFGAKYEEKDRFVFKADGNNLGQDDVNVNFRANWYGKIKGGITYDEIPHRFAFDSRTLFSGVGSDFLTLDDGLQTDLETAGVGSVAAANRLKTEFATASSSGDPEIKRKKLSGDFEFVASDPFSFRAEFSREKKDGTRPTFGAFGLDNTSEIFENVDDETLTLKLIAEYAQDQLLLNATYYYQNFNNNADSLTFDNPFSVTDNLLTGPGRGRIDMAPDNHYQNVSLAGSYSDLPFKSRISASAAKGWMRQDDDLMPFTTNTALVFPIDYSNPANLPAGDADVKVDTTLINASLAAQPLSYMRLKGRFRYYDYDNKTDRITFPDGYVNADSSPVTGALANPIATLPSSYSNTKADLNLGFDVWTRTRLNLDYTYKRTKRDNREVERQTDNIFGAAIDTAPIPWSDFRASYTRTETDIDDYNYNVYLQSGEDLEQLPGLRKYTQADVSRDRIGLLANMYPIDPLVLSASATYGKDDFKDSPYGLIEDKHYVISLDGDYTLTDRLNINAFYVYEHYKNRQIARGEFDEDGDGISTVTDWQAEGKDNVNTFGGGISYAVIPDKLDFKFTYSYSDIDGKIDFSLPNGSVPDFDTVDDTKFHTLDANLKYNIWGGFFVTLGYTWEKFDYDDYNKEGFTNVPTDASGNFQGAVLSDTLWEDYSSHIVYSKLSFKF